MNRYTRFVIACALLTWGAGSLSAQVTTSSVEPSRSISRILGIPPDSSGKCGTSALMYAHLHWNELSFQKRTALQKILSRPAKQKDRLSRSGRFRIHYDTTGFGAPSMITTGPNSQKIPNSGEQYIDSVGACFDFAWKFEVDSLGYLAPPSDGTQGGGPEYDVYVSALGTNDFGSTMGYEDPVNWITSGARTTSSTFIEIDNAFLGFRTPGMDGLRITAVHEFHHACQIGNYGFWSEAVVPNSDFWFYELSAVYMERLAYSGIHDYYFDLPSYFGRFRNSQNQSLSFTTFTLGQYPGYERSIWAQYLSQRFGRDVIRRVWMGVISDPVLVSTGKVLQANGTSLESEFALFSFWNYYTADRAQAGKYYDDAANWPRFAPNATSTFGGLSSSITSSALPLSTQFYEFAVSGDTVTAILVDVNSTSAVVPNPLSTGFQLLLTASNPSTPSQKVAGGLSLSFIPDDKSQWRTLYLESAKSTNYFASDPFPNPVRVARDSKLNLPLGGSTEKRAMVYFLNAAMELIMSREYDVSESFGSRLLSVPASDLRDGIPSGVYFVKATCGDKDFQWKVAIIQ